MSDLYRIVLDTSVLVAAFRSGTGASARLLEMIAEQRFATILSNTLLLEYESVLLRPLQMQSHGFSAQELDVFLRSFLASSELTHARRQYRPQLLDPNDEHVLEAAINGKAEAIVTHNVTDFLPGALRFRVAVITPAAIIKVRGTS